MSKKNLEETKKNLQETFMALKSRNTNLQFQCDYLRNHIEICDLPKSSPALAFLQTRLIHFASTCSQILEEHNIQNFLFGNALLGYLRHHKTLCPWDDSLQIGVMAQDFWMLKDLLRQQNLLISTNHIKNNTKFFQGETPKIDFLTLIDAQFQKKQEYSTDHKMYTTLQEKQDQTYPQNIPLTEQKTLWERQSFIKNMDFAQNEILFAVQTPFALQLFSGTSLENHVSIDIIPWYYWKESVSSRDYLFHAKDIRTQIEKCPTWEDIFTLYDKERTKNTFYTEKSKHIAPGVGSHILTYFKFSGFFPHDSVFPLQQIRLQNEIFSTFANFEEYARLHYGDYTQLPRDIGIATKSSLVEAYLKTKKRSMHMPEAQVTCKHLG